MLIINRFLSLFVLDWYRTDLWIDPLVSYLVPKYVGRKMKQLLRVSVLGKILSIQFFK
ncbi:hypothetical protein HMPREF9957_1661 [Streptococcus mitis SK1080]|uniref:Uncharacterized protein n=1 Tax=Streptococcus mitis SK1080 TaxID=1008453 RepID=F9HKJ9_STRMT|nr:hypothetical protein HMPREF9957_1661 [Streptococcus mitis SK1080]